MRSLFGVILLCHGTVVTAQQPSQPQPFSSTRQAVNAVRSATVTISVTRSDGEGVGSGFLITSDGVIATAAHVIRGASTASVRLPTGESFDVRGIIALDEARDFALLRIAGFGLPVVELGNSDSLFVGSRLLAFGAPLGFEATVSDGLLSAIRMKEGTRLFQISIPISPGSSGGPVATEDGMVIGIVVATWREDGAQNLNFALPINYLRGQIPLASGKTPVALSQMTYQPGAGQEGLRAAARTLACVGEVQSFHGTIKYLGGLGFPDFKGHESWDNTMTITADSVLMAFADSAFHPTGFACANITKIEYGQAATQHVGRWVALGLLVGPYALFGLFHKSRHHFITISFTDAGRERGVYLEANKEVFRNLLNTLSFRTQRPIYADEKERKWLLTEGIRAQPDPGSADVK